MRGSRGLVGALVGAATIAACGAVVVVMIAWWLAPALVDVIFVHPRPWFLPTCLAVSGICLFIATARRNPQHDPDINGAQPAQSQWRNARRRKETHQ